MVCVNVSAGAVGASFARFHHYKRLPMALLLLAIAGVATLAWQADHLTPLRFQLLLAVIGIGFGPVAPLSTVSMQNAVPLHQFGTSVGTMTFTRSLVATMMVALFGAIVLGSSTLAGSEVLTPVARDAQASAPAGAYSRIFAVAALSMFLSWVALLCMEERPLETQTRARD
jgi:hypothetical protein